MMNAAIFERPSSLPDAPSSIAITTTYSDQSQATGVLFHFISKDMDFNRSAVLAMEVDSSLDYTSDFNLARGEYKVLVYDIEQNGTLYNGLNYPAVSPDLTIVQNNPGIGNSLFPITRPLSRPQNVKLCALFLCACYRYDISVAL